MSCDINITSFLLLYIKVMSRTSFAHYLSQSHNASVSYGAETSFFPLKTL